MQRQTKSAAAIAQFSMTLLGKEKKSKHKSSKTFIDYLLNLNYEFHQPSFSLVYMIIHSIRILKNRPIYVLGNCAKA